MNEFLTFPLQSLILLRQLGNTDYRIILFVFKLLELLKK